MHRLVLSGFRTDRFEEAMGTEYDFSAKRIPLDHNSVESPIAMSPALKPNYKAKPKRRAGIVFGSRGKGSIKTV